MGYINMKKLVALLSAGIVLISISGCRKKQSSQLDFEESYQYETSTTTTSETISENNTELVDNIKVDIVDDQEDIIDKEIVAASNKEIETEIVAYFEDLEEEVNYYLNQENFDKMKEKAKEIAIIGIDFIFYGTEIKGITFDELTQESKEQIKVIVSSIDSKIESKIPGYKETIKDKFGRGYDYLTEKIENGLNFIDGKLDKKYGEDYQNVKDKANEVKEDIKDDASDIYDKAKEGVSDGWSKVKGWYENKTGK